MNAASLPSAQSRAPNPAVNAVTMPDVCPCCSGEGVIALHDERGDFDVWGSCHECRGTGEVFIPTPQQGGAS
jgi:DnaJ-class molecular chaperone